MNEVTTEANAKLMFVIFEKDVIDGNTRRDGYLLQNYRLHEDGNFKWVGEKSFTNKLDALETGRKFIRGEQ